MKLVLKTDTFLQNNLTTEEVLYLLLLSNGCDAERAKNKLIEKGFITQDGNLFGEFRITRSGIDAMNKVIVDSDDDVPKAGTKSLQDLVGDMRALFPKGYQQIYPVKAYPWRSSPKETEERLRNFFHKFGTKYSFDQILEATRRYTERMSGQQFMQTLKYFIWKQKDGVITSALADELSVMEEGEEEKHSEDWQNTMI